MTVEDTILKYSKWFKINLILTMLITFTLVIVGAFYELNHPNSELSKQILGYANNMILGTIISASPLLYLKAKSVESWNEIQKDRTAEEKRQALWIIVKPFLKEAMVAVIVFIIIMILFNYFDIIPQSTIENYKQYYATKKLMGF